MIFSIMLSWFYLSVAIVFGVLGTVCMKLSQSIPSIKPVLPLIIFYVISFIAMTFALRYMDMSLVYAIWSGIGTILIVIISYFIFNESMSMRKIISLLFVIVGIVGVHLANAIH